jgi:serine protease Do
VVQFDPRSDLAVLKIKATDLPVVDFGDLDSVRQGQWAFTVGNPFGVANNDGKTAFAFGIVEATGRELTHYIEDAAQNDRYYGNLLQTTASINPGNSGGPLFDIDGKVIGISTAMVSNSGVNEGLGFAIPISARTRALLDTLARGEVVRYGFLGVQVGSLRPDQARDRGITDGRGAIIYQLSDETSTNPARQAGLRELDVITRFAGVDIENADHLIRVVGATPVGNEVEVEFKRGDQNQKAKITLIERASTAAARSPDREPRSEFRTMVWRGVELFEPSRSFLRSRGIARRDSGLFIRSVPSDSELHGYGVRDGSLIVRLNGDRVRTLDEFRVGLRLAGDGEIRLEFEDGETVVLPK